MLHICIDNANLRKDILNIKDKLTESTKELIEVKLRHVFEMDELKLTNEDKIENILTMNSNLQSNVDKYQNKVLELHKIMKEKDDSVVEMKRKHQVNLKSLTVEKNDCGSKIQALQNQIEPIQLENKKLKSDCQELEDLNSKLSDSIKILEHQLQSADRAIDKISTQNCSHIINTLEMSDDQLQTELNDLHALLKEKSHTINEIKRKRNGNWVKYKDVDKKGYICKLNSLENDIKKIQLENDHLKTYCKEIENSKTVMIEKINMLENNQLKVVQDKQKLELEGLRSLVKEKDDTINWIETKMMESFESMSIKTKEYEEKLTTFENQMKSLQSENRLLKYNELGQSKRTLVDCNENVGEPLSKTVDKTSDSESSCSNSTKTNAVATPSKTSNGKKVGIKRMFSKSFRKLVRDKSHVKDKGINDDNEMFYISEKDEN